jgi:hypothetical protein
MTTHSAARPGTDAHYFVQGIPIFRRIALEEGLIA